MKKVTFVPEPDQEVCTGTSKVLTHSIVIGGKQPLGCHERKDRFGGLSYL
jgi:hypothetical protein